MSKILLFAIDEQLLWNCAKETQN